MTADRPSAPVREADNPPASPPPAQGKPAPQPVAFGRSDLEHNREAMTRPPMQRPDNPAGTTQWPDATGTSRNTPPASSATRHPGSDAAAPGKTENAERTGSASTDNGNSAGHRTAEGPRSTSENTSDIIIGPPVQTADDKRVEAIEQPTTALNPAYPGDGHLSSEAPSQATEQAGSRPQHEAARARDSDDSREFPNDTDREQGRAIYAEWRQSIVDGRNQGANVVGEELSESPGTLVEGRDPPTGKQLLEMEDPKRSRFDAFRHDLEGEENLDGLHDEVEQDGHTLQGILEHPPVATHAEQRMPDTPHYMPVSAAGIDGGSVAGSALLLGVFAAEMGRRIHVVFDHKKGVG